jgi:hypothetical protein
VWSDNISLKQREETGGNLACGWVDGNVPFQIQFNVILVYQYVYLLVGGNLE